MEPHNRREIAIHKAANDVSGRTIRKSLKWPRRAPSICEILSFQWMIIQVMPRLRYSCKMDYSDGLANITAHFRKIKETISNSSYFHRLKIPLPIKRFPII